MIPYIYFPRGMLVFFLYALSFVAWRPDDVLWLPLNRLCRALPALEKRLWALGLRNKWRLGGNAGMRSLQRQMARDSCLRTMHGIRDDLDKERIVSLLLVASGWETTADAWRRRLAPKQ